MKYFYATLLHYTNYLLLKKSSRDLNIIYEIFHIFVLQMHQNFKLQKSTFKIAIDVAMLCFSNISVFWVRIAYR